jgi:tetratricopeptide (TPR) repeat protein
MKSPTIPKRYEVRSLLGEGGSGRVYRVQDSIRDRELALKLVTPAESAFLRREFDTLRQIRHENLIQVFDWGVLPSGEAYYTMELIEGGGATRMGEPQPADDVRHVLTGLLRGLAHLHCHGEIHGDLKPGNILLGAGGVVKITDAGMGGSGERADGLSGTPGYAAPEVWEGAPADVRSDLYSVGVMAYEALTGKHPFAGRTVREVISGQLEGWVPSPGAHGVRVPADLERVVMRALERQPGLRQGSADEFMEGFGVEDRIGEILGGKLVGREKEIAEIRAWLQARTPGSPTLVRVVGPSGIGKSAFVEEVCDIVVRAGGQVNQPGIEIADLAGLAKIARPRTEVPGAEQGWIAEIGDSLWNPIISTPHLVWVSANSDRPSESTPVESLARYLWALSAERQAWCPVCLIGDQERPPTGNLEFERVMVLGPLPPESVEASLAGTLGTISFDPRTMQTIVNASGGNPGALFDLIVDLIDKRLVHRQNGTWSLRSVEDLREVRSPAHARRWAIAWEKLGDGPRRVASALAMSPSGLPVTAPGSGKSDHLPTDEIGGLFERGWLRSARGRWQLASPSARAFILSRMSDGDRAGLAQALLGEYGGIFSREERADLQLSLQASAGQLTEGLWAAEQALQRGNYRLAESRLTACLRAAKGDGEESQRISLMLCQALHRLGEERSALEQLMDPEVWGKSGDGSGQREHLLGLIKKGMGETDSARNHFKEAIRRSEESGDRAVSLRSHAELAELDWTYGDRVSRAGAIQRIREVIQQPENGSGLEEEYAALTYGLGAALVLDGAIAEAQDVLNRGLSLRCSEYWHARMAIALGAAAGSSGRYLEASNSYSNAWRYAEKGSLAALKSRILANRGGVSHALGRLHESLELDSQAALWARRLGNRLEYVHALAGMTINRINLADYATAIGEADEVITVATELAHEGFKAKGLELGALARFYVGDLSGARTWLLDALEVVQSFDSFGLKPRLDWLFARLEDSEGNYQAAEELLQRAEAALLVSRDLEDLWGVQVELIRIRGRSPDAGESSKNLSFLIDQARKAGSLHVQISGVLALAEIKALHGNGDQYIDLITEALGIAAEGGFRESAWRLSYALGRMAAESGDAKEAQLRFNSALRVLKEIAEGLGPQLRERYLQSRHVRHALERLQSPGQS